MRRKRKIKAFFFLVCFTPSPYPTWPHRWTDQGNFTIGPTIIRPNFPVPLYKPRFLPLRIGNNFRREGILRRKWKSGEGEERSNSGVLKALQFQIKEEEEANIEEEEEPTDKQISIASWVRADFPRGHFYLSSDRFTSNTSPLTFNAVRDEPQCLDIKTKKTTTHTNGHWSTQGGGNYSRFALIQGCHSPRSHDK